MFEYTGEMIEGMQIFFLGAPCRTTDIEETSIYFRQRLGGGLCAG